MRDDDPIQTDSGPSGKITPDAGVEGRESEGPAPALNFRILACLWIFVSAGAVYLLARDPAWRSAPDFLGSLRAVRVEQWVAVSLLGVQTWLLLRARRRE